VTPERRASDSWLAEKLDNIHRDVTQTNLDLSVLRTEVLGTDGRGRLPQLEKKVEEAAAKVSEHDKFVTRATWTVRIAGLLGAGGIAAIVKQKFGIGN
jgi:hypothetical protein